jgi:3-oxoacyl-[acyl-carrier protein] reductase
MDLKLSGKRALVTGSSAGLGEPIVKLLAAEGVTVVVPGGGSKVYPWEQSDLTKTRKE